jgi:hypothetical protein
MLNVGQIGFYLMNNELHSAQILSRKIVENVRELGQTRTVEQEKMYMRFGESGVTYSTVHGEFPGNRVFASKNDLVESYFGPF